MTPPSLLPLLSSASRSTPSPPSSSARLSSLENGLRAKLTGLENAVAKVALVKAQLRANTDQSREELAASVSSALQQLRNREQQLAGQLDRACRRKEAALSLQQDTLLQHIGACQQSLDSLRRASPSTEQDASVQEMLFRLNSLDFHPCESAQVSLEVDALRLRATLSDWGRIVVDEGTANRRQQAGESLPLEMEEDDFLAAHLMAHKSVMRIGSNTPSPAVGNEDARISAKSVREWLSLQSAPLCGEAPIDIDALLDDSDMRSSSTEASYEVIGRSGGSSTAVSAHTNKALERPLHEWLLPGTRQHAAALPPAIASPNQNAVAPTSFEFEGVMTRIRESADAEWLAATASTAEEEETKEAEEVPEEEIEEAVQEKLRIAEENEEMECGQEGLPPMDSMASPGRKVWQKVFDRTTEPCEKWLAPGRAD